MCGVNDSHIQHCLLSEPVLTLETAMKIAPGMKSASQNVIILEGGGGASAPSLGEVLKFTGAKPSSSKQQMPW